MEYVNEVNDEVSRLAEQFCKTDEQTNEHVIDYLRPRVGRLSMMKMQGLLTDSEIEEADALEDLFDMCVKHVEICGDSADGDDGDSDEEDDDDDGTFAAILTDRACCTCKILKRLEEALEGAPLTVDAKHGKTKPNPLFDPYVEIGREFRKQLLAIEELCERESRV